MIYFDHNATSPLLPVAREAWLEAADRFTGNPSSPHRLGSRAEHALDDARQRLAKILDCSAADILWTSGATEACNAVLYHVSAADADSRATAFVSVIEHPAVLQSARHYFGSRLEVLTVNDQGVVDLATLRSRLIRQPPALVALMAANNETGVLQPWREAQTLCEAQSVPFFCDSTQWLGRLPARELGRCAFVAGSAHKFGGPRGVGFLKIPGGTALRPLLHGGKQQSSQRAGTENVAGILAMVTALEWCEQQIAGGGIEQRRILREQFERALQAAMPAVAVNGAGADRLWNTINIIMPEADCRQRWVVKLDKAGFAVSTGSACASGSEEPSHVLIAMNRSSSEAARALRFSSGWMTTETDWQALLAAIARVQKEFAPAHS